MAKQAIEGATRGNVFYVNPHGNATCVIQVVGLDTPHKEGEHPLWDERIGLDVDPKLVANIRAYGVLSAVKLRKNGKTDDGREILEVVAGRQRTRACRAAYDAALAAGEEPPLLKVEVERRPEEEQIGVMISENEQRRNDGPAVRAKKIGRCVSMGHATGSIARMFGITEQSVSLALRFNELALPVRKAVDVGQLAYSAALELHGLSHEKQVGALVKLAVNTDHAHTGHSPSNGSNGKARKPRAATAKAVKRAVREDDTTTTIPWTGIRITAKTAGRLLKDETFRATLVQDHESEVVGVVLALLELVGGDGQAHHVELIEGLEDAIKRAES